MGFIKLPDLRVADGGQWQLSHPMTYVARSGEKITVPKGFITDLASIPQVLQGIVPVNGLHRHAAILHDYLYVIQDRTRVQADGLFLEAMAGLDVRFTQRWAMYLAVRAAGWLFWSRNIEDRKADLPAFLRRNGL